MTDFRALCAELVGDIEEWMNGTDHFPPSSVELLDRARAALAQPEPQGPTDEELTWLWNHVATNRQQRMTWFEVDCLPETDYQQFARSVLRQWGCPTFKLELGETVLPPDGFVEADHD
jgi:hypothetical protein